MGTDSLGNRFTEEVVPGASNMQDYMQLRRSGLEQAKNIATKAGFSSTAGYGKRSQDTQRYLSDVASRLGFMTKNIPSLIEHYSPASKKDAVLAGAYDTGLTSGMNTYSRDRGRGLDDLTSQQHAGIKVLEGVLRGAIGARPGGDAYAQAVNPAFNAMYLLSQGASAEDIDREKNRVSRTLGANPENLLKYLDPNITATQHHGGNWGKNQAEW